MVTNRQHAVRCYNQELFEHKDTQRSLAVVFTISVFLAG